MHMRTYARTLVGMAGLLFAGETALAQERQLTEGEIRAFVSGQTIGIGELTVTYGRDGRYRVITPTKTETGRWSFLPARVGGSALCVHFDGGGRRCDIIYRMADGTTVLDAHGRGQRLIMSRSR
jgi:hypothetical protein